MTDDVEHLVTCLLAIQVSSLEKYCTLILCLLGYFSSYFGFIEFFIYSGVAFCQKKHDLQILSPILLAVISLFVFKSFLLFS
jgi:hypothetical protein